MPPPRPTERLTSRLELWRRTANLAPTRAKRIKGVTWLIGVLGSYRQHSQNPERRRTGRQPCERTESEAEHDPPDDDSPTLKVMQARPQVAAQFSRTNRERKSKVGHLLAPWDVFLLGSIYLGVIRLRKRSRRRTRKFGDANLNCQRLRAAQTSRGHVSCLLLRGCPCGTWLELSRFPARGRRR
jgi:hypothetical protein